MYSLLTGNPVTLHACNIIQTLEKDTRWETRVRLKSHIAVPALKWEIQKMRRDQIQFTPNTTRMKTINFPIFFFHAVSNCWRMKLKITIKYFFTALQANVNQNHLFFWFRNFICRHSARLVGPKQNYVNWEKMQTTMLRVEFNQPIPASGQLKTEHALDHTATMTVAITVTWTKLTKTNNLSYKITSVFCTDRMKSNNKHCVKLHTSNCKL